MKTMKYNGNFALEQTKNVEAAIKSPELLATFEARKIYATEFDADPGDETITWGVINGDGIVKITRAGTTEVPLSETDETPVTIPLVYVEGAYQITRNEDRKMKKTGKKLDKDKLSVVMVRMSEMEDKLIFDGDSKTGVKSVFEVEGIQEVIVANGASGSKLWTSKTGKEMVADIKRGRNKVNNIKGLEADTLVISYSLFEVMDNTYMGEKAEKTVVEYLIDSKIIKRIALVKKDIDPYLADTRSQNAKIKGAIDMKALPTGVDLLQNKTTVIEHKVAGLALKQPLSHCIIKGVK